MSRFIMTDTVRNLIIGARNSIDEPLEGHPSVRACAVAVANLLAHCDALDEEPEDYGFEFVSDDPNVGNEGERSVHYAYRYMGDLPEGCTASYYILAPDDGHPDDASIERYRGVVYDADGDEISDSDYADVGYFETVAEVVVWFNEQLGGPVIKRLPDTKGQP
jgi:hypothetical protein